MLVAKRQVKEYDTSYKSKPKPTVTTKRRKVTKKKTQNKMLVRSKVKVVIGSILVFSLCIGMLLLNANISSLNYKLLGLKKKKDILIEERNLLEIEIDKVKQSDWIEEAAINSGLIYPTKEQKIYVSVNDIIDDNQEDKTEKKDTFLKSTFNKLLGFINN
ncbi:hypothetical protein PV797_11670 [Clostridiaceae bacterium M8S5]|nr:hypothetical protein PV797_11670 [Clostridiaceae bacterium M8S5]